MSSEASIRAYANCDDTDVVWRYPEVIPGCRGFALFRRPEGSDPAPVRTFVPFAVESKQGEHRPSAEWPIQRFTWADVFATARRSVIGLCRWLVRPAHSPKGRIWRAPGTHR